MSRVLLAAVLLLGPLADATPGVVASVVRLPGILTVEGERYRAPSHGGEYALGVARFRLYNESGAPLSVTLGPLIAKADDPDVPPVPLTIDFVHVSDPDAPPDPNRPPRIVHGSTITIAPHQTLAVEAWANLRGGGARYHTTYHHECAFAVGAQTILVRAGRLYFRFPRAR